MAFNVITITTASEIYHQRLNEGPSSSSSKTNVHLKEAENRFKGVIAKALQEGIQANAILSGIKSEDRSLVKTWINQLQAEQVVERSAASLEATVPVVDLKDYYDPEKKESFVKTIYAALHTDGFFGVTNTGVDVRILDEAYKTAEEFFNLPTDIKLQCNVPELNVQRGYIVGETAKGQVQKDYKEFYHIGEELPSEELKKSGMPANVWPSEINFKEPMVKLYGVLREKMLPIQRAIALAMGQEEGFFDQLTQAENNLLRATYYPENPPNGRPWAAEHTDLNLFTLLPRATARGLQVKRETGEWVDVVVPDGAFIVNGADVLESMTNGELRSGVHRVVDNGEGKPRISMVFFVNVVGTTSVVPLPESIARTGGVPKYSDRTAWELLMERIADLGKADQSMLKMLGESGTLEKQLEVHRESYAAMKAVADAGFASERVVQALASEKKL